MNPEGKNVKTLRERHGISQADFAKKVGVAQGLVGLIETGKRSLTPKTARKIAEAFGIDPEILFNEGMEIPAKADPFKQQYADCLLVESKVLASFPGIYLPGSDNIAGTFRIPGLPHRDEPYLAVRVEGPSMEPTIRQGDTLIIDKMESRSEFVDDKIYVLIMDNMALVKRVRIGTVEDGLKVNLVSDNGNRVQEVPWESIQVMYKTLYVIKDFV